MKTSFQRESDIFFKPENNFVSYKGICMLSTPTVLVDQLCTTVFWQWL